MITTTRIDQTPGNYSLTLCFRIGVNQTILKCDSVFQIVYNVVHNGHKKTTMHINLSEAIHNACRSKKMIQIMNRMGLCMSYDELERVDIGLAHRTINAAGSHRVSIPPSIIPSILIHGAMDNFDHEENTSSGIGGSHDTILMLFQYTDIEDDNDVRKISQKPHEHSTNKRALEHIMDCQKLVRSKHFSKRGEFAPDFKPGKILNRHSITSTPLQEFKMWVIARHMTQSEVSSHKSFGIPSFSAVNSLLMSDTRPQAHMAFTPILPHPATDFDTIHISMIFKMHFCKRGFSVVRCGAMREYTE